MKSNRNAMFTILVFASRAHNSLPLKLNCRQMIKLLLVILICIQLPSCSMQRYTIRETSNLLAELRNSSVNKDITTIKIDTADTNLTRAQVNERVKSVLLAWNEERNTLVEQRGSLTLRSGILDGGAIMLSATATILIGLPENETRKASATILGGGEYFLAHCREH